MCINSDKSYRHMNKKAQHKKIHKYNISFIYIKFTIYKINSTVKGGIC